MDNIFDLYIKVGGILYLQLEAFGVYKEFEGFEEFSNINEFVEQYNSFEFDRHDHIDYVCLKFVAYREWSELESDLDKFLVFQRLKQAQLFLNVLRYAFEPPSHIFEATQSLTESKLLGYLLVDVHQEGMPSDIFFWRDHIPEYVSLQKFSKHHEGDDNSLN